MPLSKEEKAQLEALQNKAKEPEGLPGNLNVSLDLSSDSAWERAKHLGLVRDPEPAGEDEDEDDDNDPPKRRGGGSNFFGQ